MRSCRVEQSRESRYQDQYQYQYQFQLQQLSDQVRRGSPAVGRRTAVGLGSLLDRPGVDAAAAAAAAGRRTAGPGVGSPAEAAVRTGLPEVAGHIAAGPEARRTGLVGERRTGRPGVGRRSPAGEVLRSRRLGRRSCRVGGWSSRPWRHRNGRWHRGGA